MKERGTAPLIEAELTRTVIGCFYRVHRELGFGFREHIYALALERELLAAKLRVERELGVTVYYRARPLAQQKVDFLVERKLLLEIKSSELLPRDATAQLFGYLAATDLEVGLVLHFGREPKFYRVVFENRLKSRNARAQSPGAASGIATPADSCARLRENQVCSSSRYV